MSLFGLEKKKAEKETSCCGGSNCTTETMEQAEQEKMLAGVKILGGGCAKCNQLEKATIEALIELGMDSTIDHVRDYEKIAAYGVMTTPALVVDGKVVSYGKVLKKDEVIELSGLKKEEQDLLSEIVFILKEILNEDKTRDSVIILKYLYHFLQAYLQL